MTFQYATDVGVYSVSALEAFAHSSNIQFSVTSTTSGGHVNGSYHYKGNAIDMGSSPGQMQQLAAFLYQYAPYWLELIHSGGSGYFVKNGDKVGAAYYGAATVSQHYNHVHFAATLSGLAAAGGAAGSANGTTPATGDTVLTSFDSSAAKETPGCAIPGLTMLAGLSVISYELAEVIRAIIS